MTCFLMTPCVQGFTMTRVAVFLVLFGAVHNVLGGGHVEVHFLRYTDTCEEDWGTNRCDPMFTFCLTRPNSGSISLGNCYYANTGETSDHYHNTNHVDMEFESNILGVPNPWVVAITEFVDTTVKFEVRIRDADIFEHDHLQTMNTILPGSVAASKEQSIWTDVALSQNSYVLRIKARMYCDPYYYTSSCKKYCKPEDSSSGHYTCDHSTGDKICLSGWMGINCTEDIDECAQGKCVQGNCTNLPGDYSCDCPPNYTDKTCSSLMNPCRSQPCMNGGTCFAHHTEHDYFCQCLSEYKGKNCEISKDPCQSQPCLNNGSCTVSFDRTSYTCYCDYAYTGVNCETEDTTSTLTTTITTSEEPTTFSDYINSTTTAAPITSKPSTAVKIMFDSTEKPTDARADNVHQQKHENAGSNFELWYIALILAALLIALLVVILLIFRRRRKTAKILFPLNSPTVSFTGDNLNFENGMYADINRNNSEIERQTRNLPPLPQVTSSSTDDDEEIIIPIKPAYMEVNEVGGAEGGYKLDDSDLKKKSSENLVKTSSSTLGALQRSENQRAQINPYTDFKSLKDSQLGVKEQELNVHPEESHYHDLDEIAATIQGTDASPHEPNESSDGTFNFDFQATPFVDVQTSPYDSPTNNNSYYDTPPVKLGFPSPLVPGQTGNLANDEGLIGSDNFTLTQDTTASASDFDDSSSDSEVDGVLQEDLAQLRKAVIDDMQTSQMEQND